MAECKTPSVNVVKIVNGSILTFECIAKLSNDRPNTMETLQFIDELQTGLTFYPNITDPDLTVSYSTNCGAYIPLDPDATPPGYTFTATATDPATLTVNIPEGNIPDSTTSQYTFVKIQFKVQVTDVAALDCNLTNTGTFNMLDATPAVIGSAEVNLCRSIVEEYDFMVAGYSLNVCGDSCSSCLEAVTPCGQSFDSCNGSSDNEFSEDFTAAFLFTAMNGDYGDPTDPDSQANYVITIRPTEGFEFPTTPADLDGIKVSIASGCLCHGSEIETATATVEGGNLVITIPHNGTTATGCDMGGKTILVTIPYQIDDCAESPSTIEGSIQLIAPGSTTPTPSLDNFCLCVNSECSQLMGVRKTILC
ncbi:MAG: hypothetical protein Q4B63_08415 [Clostridium perfringens]|nr:hypothetical protein [Clostridium perfringens]